MMQDKAGTAYWQGVWQQEIPNPIDLDDRSLDNHFNRRLGRLFERQVPLAQRGEVLLEAGCGASAWLPVFARRFGYRVVGIDYSEKGCRLAEAVLRKAGVDGNVVQADLFDLPDRFAAVADVVYSLGLVEHFTPTESVVDRLAWLVKPGGMVVTLVPNMRGLTGRVQRMLDRRVYDLHVPLDAAALARAHELCGLHVRDTLYVGTLNLSVANHESWASQRLMYQLIARAKAWPSKIVWLLERLFGAEVPNRYTSPFIACIATKPADLGIRS